MPSNRVIPSLLLQGGRLVKGVRFADHRDAGSPATTIRAHSAQGADEILLLDIDASRKGREPDFMSLDAAAAEAQVPLTFGGGLNSVDRIHRAIESGADKVCLTSTALDSPQLIEDAAHRFGAQAVVVGIDATVRDGAPRLYDHRSGEVVEGRALGDWIAEVAGRGAGEIRLCSVDREGSRRGLDLALYELARASTDVPIILEGGAGNLAHVAEAMNAGVDSVALGTILVFSDNNLVKVRRFLVQAGLEMRP